MIVSPVHMAEIQAIANPRERLELVSMLERLRTPITVELMDVRRRAESLYSMGLGVADAAHVAFAEASADVFISCDDRLIRIYRRKRVHIPVMNPIEFCMQEDLR